VADSIHHSSHPRAMAEGFGEGGGTDRGQGLWGVVASVPGVVDEKNGTVLFFAEPALDGGGGAAGINRADLEGACRAGAGRTGAGAGAPGGGSDAGGFSFG